MTVKISGVNFYGNTSVGRQKMPVQMVWGLNNAGQLGLGDITNRSAPVQINATRLWSSVSSGSTRSFGIKADGTLWAWGTNFYGELGLGNTIYYSSPKQVGILTNWSKVSAGGQHTIATDSNNRAWAWGDDTRRQTGIYNPDHNTSFPTPQHVGYDIWGAYEFSTITTGYYHSIGIKPDGTLWAWGYNAYGQLGLGNAGSLPSDSPEIPDQVIHGVADKQWADASCGYFHSTAIATDGTLWAWGSNDSGQLGLGNTTQYSSPKQVGALTNWRAVSNGNFFTTAIKTDGTLWAWGNNDSGQLGLGNTNYYSSPKQVGTLSNWAHITSGAYHTASIKTDGTLWAWGSNYHGQLGLNNTTYYSSPKQVGTLTNWLSISSSGYSAIATVNI